MENQITDAVSKLSTKVKVALALLGALVIAPIIFMVVQGLIGLIIAGLVGLAVINFAPVVALKFANWKLQGMKGEARANPIETRQQLAIQARQRIAGATEALTEFATEVRNFEDQVKELRRTQPDDADDFDQQLESLQKLLTLKREGLAAAKQSALEFEQATERAAKKWKVAQAAIRMQKLAGQAANDAMGKILAEESLDAVQTAMNRALSELDSAIATSAGDVLANKTGTK